MPYSVTYDAEARGVVIQGKGPIRIRELRDFLPEVIRLLKLHDCFWVLSDFREATFDLVFSEWYLLPQVIFDLLTPQELPSYKFRRALVVKKVDRDIRFFETASRNRGQYVKVFEDMELAKQWLRAPD